MLVSESFPSVVQIFETGGDNVSEGSQVGNIDRSNLDTIKCIHSVSGIGRMTTEE